MMMEANTVIPAPPDPEIILPRMTCHIFCPTPLDRKVFISVESLKLRYTLLLLHEAASSMLDLFR